MGKFKDIWDRSKDGDRRAERSFLRTFIVATTIFLLFVFFNKDNLFSWIHAGLTVSRQEKQIEWYKQDNARLDKQINMMSTNRDTLEKYAREHFGFAREGDEVYMLEK